MSSSLCPVSPYAPQNQLPSPRLCPSSPVQRGMPRHWPGGLGTRCLHLAYPGTNCPPFPACVLASCGSTGMSHRAPGSCSRWGDLSALPSCHRQDYILCRQLSSSVVVLTPHHCQALGRGQRWGWNKGTDSPGTAGRGAALQRYESVLSDCPHECRGSSLDKKVIRKRINAPFPSVW